MSTDMERSLRTVLADLVDAPPPTGVAARAIRRATRRSRRVKVGSALAAAAGVVAVSVAVLGPGGPLSRVDDVATQPADDGSRVVQAYSGCRTEDDVVFSLVLNMSTGEYERLPYHLVLPSPDATRLFAVATNPDSAMMAIVDRATGETLVPRRDDDEPISGSWPPQWSPDGSTIMLTRFGGDGAAAGFTLLDAATLRQTASPSLAPPPDEVILAVSFTADGEGVMAVHGPINRDNPFQATGELTVTRYTLDGALVGSTPLGVPAFEAVVVSADRTEVLVADPSNSYVTIVSLADGSTSVIETWAAGPPTWFDERVIVFGSHGIVPLGTVLPVRLPVPAPPVADCTLYIDPVVGPGAGLPGSADYLKLELFD